MDNQVSSVAFQFPWASLITGVLAVSSALGGAFLANLFAEKRWSKQIEHERDVERRKLMREKGEEAFFILRRWQTELFVFHASRIGFIQGTITAEKLKSNIDEKVNSDTHAKLDVIFSIYFDELTHHLALVHTQTKKLQKLFNQHSKVIPNLAIAEIMMEEAAVYEQQCELLERKLKIALKEYL